MTYVIAMSLSLNPPSTDLVMQANKTSLQKSAWLTISAVPVVALVAQLLAMKGNNKTSLNPWIVHTIRAITPMTGSLNAWFLVVDVQASKTMEYKQSCL